MAYVIPYVCCLLMVLLFYRFDLIYAIFWNPGFFFIERRQGMSCLKCTRMSAIVLSFNWGHEEPPGVDLRAAIVRLEDLRAEIRKYRESADRSEKISFFFFHQKNPFG